MSLLLGSKQQVGNWSHPVSTFHRLLQCIIMHFCVYNTSQSHACMYVGSILLKCNRVPAINCAIYWRTIVGALQGSLEQEPMPMDFATPKAGIVLPCSLHSYVCKCPLMGLIDLNIYTSCIISYAIRQCILSLLCQSCILALTAAFALCTSLKDIQVAV